MDDKSNGDLHEIAQLFTDYSGESRIREMLRRDLLNRIEHPPARPQGVSAMLYGTPRRRLAFAVSTLLVIILTVLIIPPFQSWAQDVLRQIGVIALTDEPTDAEREVQRLNNHEPIPTAIPVERELNESACDTGGPFDLAEASARVGFPVYEPTYLPASVNYYLTGRDSLQGPYRAVSRSVYLTSTPDTLVLMQAQSTTPGLFLWKTPAGIQTADVTINGLPALWIENYPDEEALTQFHSPFVTGVNLLVWEQAGYTFLLESFVLPQNQMIRVAESLMPSDIVPDEASESACQTPFLGREQISNLTGMPAYEPVYLPEDFYLWSRGRSDTRAVHTTYQRYTAGWFMGYAVEDIIHLIQYHAGDETEEIPIGDAPVINVTVKGQPAVWVDQWAIYYQPADTSDQWDTIDANQPMWETVGANLLIWEADDYTFMLQGVLPQDEMIRIAESVSAD